MQLTSANGELRTEKGHDNFHEREVLAGVPQIVRSIAHVRAKRRSDGAIEIQEYGEPHVRRDELRSRIVRIRE